MDAVCIFSGEWQDKAREQAGIVLVTGDLGEARALSDRIGVMFGGAVVEMIDCNAMTRKGSNGFRN